MAEPANNFWTCSACSASNAESDATCATCGAPRTVGVRYAATLALPAIPSTPDIAPPPATRSTPASGNAPRRPRELADMATMQVEIPAAIASADIHPTMLDAPAVRAPRPPRRGIPDSAARAIPLAALALIGTAAFTYNVVHVLETEAAAHAAAPAPSVAPSLQTVDLAAATAVVGLSEDNKEAVLTACWRISPNPTHECQPDFLRQQGEYPAVEVPVGPLRVDRFEVSNAEYERCVAEGECTARDLASCRFYTIHRYELGVAPPTAMLGENRPAVCVTYDEAAAFCAARDMRLPTNEEWERLARSGEDRMYPWGTFWLPALLNWGERDMLGFPITGRLDGAELTAAVDEYADGRTDDGVLNVLGNAAEWVQPHSEDGEGNASARGGNYTDDVSELRITTRTVLPKSERRTTVGFRCVASVPATP